MSTDPMNDKSAAVMSSTSVHSELDFTAEGKQSGYLRLPHSVHRSAYGWIPIPVASIRNGDGPKVLLMAGNHGDEYEGQVLLSQLIREIEPDMVTGQIIILPMANFPAAEAGTRTSPIDGGNLNRLFPGSPVGTPTHLIAHYIEAVLMKDVSLLVDLHSGGSSLTYIPSVLASDGATPEESHRLRELAAAFGLPNTILFPPADGGHSSEGGALRNGGIGISTELGGAGMVTPTILAMARRGLLNLLGHVGVLNGALIPEGAPGATRYLRLDDPKLFVYAREPGVFEPLVELGEAVTKGQPAARLHFTETPGREPLMQFFEADGIVMCKRVPARSQRGDCLFHLAAPIPT